MGVMSAEPTDVTELLRVDSLQKLFPLGRHSHIAAVNGVSFSIRRGETLGLVGESGSGKTTVGRCILRLIEPTAGKIVLEGEDITRLSDARIRSLRPRMQLVFQDPFGSLNPRLSVRETIEEPLILEGRSGSSERKQRIVEILQLMKMNERHLSMYPVHLTASEQQRVGIARAVVTHPSLIVLDEPTSNLDPSARSEILDVLIELQERFGTSYLFISHDLTAVERVSHRIAVMYLGRIVEVGTCAQIMNHQFHPYTKALLSAVLFPDPRRKLAPFNLIGEIPSAIDPRDECPLIGRCPFAKEYCANGFPAFEEVEDGHFTACYRWKEIQADSMNPVGM
jgi:oligopeptide/dipeptide ABC transporter ATP-binding protein